MYPELDPRLLADAACRLGFDLADRRRLVDLAAVAMTRLAWRDGPVEDWHAVPRCRISNPEMMRANAATTRMLRDLLDAGLPNPLVAWLPSGAAEELLVGVHAALVDPGRRLPDGRTLVDLAPDEGELVEFDRHVRDYCDLWLGVLTEVDLPLVLLLLACHGARFCPRWWLASGWPRIVDEFLRRLAEPARWSNPRVVEHVRRLVPPPDATGDQLRAVLLAGPDRLSGEAATYCLRAGLEALLPLDCGLPPTVRHVLPPAYFRMIDYPLSARG